MCGMHTRHEGTRRAAVEGLWRDGALVVRVASNSSPAAWRMAEPSRVVGATAGVGWRAALTPSCVSPVLFVPSWAPRAFT